MSSVEEVDLAHRIAVMGQRAKRVLEDNDRGSYTVPTAKLYPFQWNWDSAFVALGWAEVDRERAWLEIETLLSAQWPSGMVPHIVFWTREDTYFPGPDTWRAEHGPQPSSGISQPPVLASVLRQLTLEHPHSSDGGVAGDKARVAAVFDALNRWHQWWHTARDPKGLGVIAISHPWESGRDNLPDWDIPAAAIDASGIGPYERRDTELVDASMRPHKHDYDRYLALVKFGADQGWDDAAIAAGNEFWVVDPGITAILLRAERDLLKLGLWLGRDADELASISLRIERMEGGYDRMWNPEAGTYTSIDLRSGDYASTGTSASFLAAYAGVTERTSALVDELSAWSEHCPFLVPSFDPRDSRFEPNRYWRGPVWAMVNYMISTGLAEVGEGEWADRIRLSTREMMLQSGFPESFSPTTGESVGGLHFAWTAAIWLSWLNRM